MSLEIYWKKALEQTQLSIDDESLYPLKTDIITRDLYEKDDFIIRKLDTSKFNKKKNLWSYAESFLSMGKDTRN